MCSSDLDAAFATAVRDLHRRLYSERATDAWVTDIDALFAEVEAADGEEAAWAAVVATMLRDPAFVLE